MYERWDWRFYIICLSNIMIINIGASDGLVDMNCLAIIVSVASEVGVDVDVELKNGLYKGSFGNGNYKVIYELKPEEVMHSKGWKEGVKRCFPVDEEVPTFTTTPENIGISFNVNDYNKAYLKEFIENNSINDVSSVLSLIEDKGVIIAWVNIGSHSELALPHEYKYLCMGLRKSDHKSYSTLFVSLHTGRVTSRSLANFEKFLNKN